SVDDEAKRRGGDAYDVEHPESRLRDWRERVVADRRAPRLERIADEHLLLVGVHVFGCHGDDQKPEYDHDGQPEAADHGGVMVNGVQQTFEQSPL
ncbi:hypothetical protein NQD34_001377, partial [Periophthalmus magnuspinnatus]